MKSKTSYLTFNTREKIGILNITQEVGKVVFESDIKEGLCFINDEEGSLKDDSKKWLKGLARSSSKLGS